MEPKKRRAARRKQATRQTGTEESHMITAIDGAGNPEEALRHLECRLASELAVMDCKKMLPPPLMNRLWDLVAQTFRQTRALRRKKQGGFAVEDLVDRYDTERN
jgi:hypothetical protein